MGGGAIPPPTAQKFLKFILVVLENPKYCACHKKQGKPSE